jgi:hypothetical protein
VLGEIAVSRGGAEVGHLLEEIFQALHSCGARSVSAAHPFLEPCLGES